MKSWFVVSTTQIPIFVLFVSTGVLFDGAFTLWVSLRELIFAGIDFHEFYEFLTILQKLVSAKFIGGCATREIREN